MKKRVKITVLGAENRAERRKVEAIARKTLDLDAILNPQPPQGTIEMTPAPKKQTKTRQFTSPIYLKKLLEHMSNVDVAEEIGLSETHVSTSAREATPWAVPYELAAEHLYTKKFGRKIGMVQALLSLPCEHMPTVQQVVQSLGGKIMVVE